MRDDSLFATGAVRWRRTVIEDGQAYSWRSECGRYAARRIGRGYRGMAHGRLLGSEFETLTDAMLACVWGG